MIPSGMPTLLIDKYFITRTTSPDGTMVLNVPEWEEFPFILYLILALKLLVYPFGDGIVVHDVSSLDLANTD